MFGLHACMYKEISCVIRLVRLLQGKGSVKYAHEDSYKEKTSNPRKRCQPSTTIKASIPWLTKVRIIHPSPRTLELQEVLTRPSEGIWLAPNQCSLWGLLFFVANVLFRASEDRVTYRWFFGIITLENLFPEMSSFETNGIKSPMSNGSGPESSLAERSNSVKCVQFSMSQWNWPLSIMWLSWIFKASLASGCQHSTPTNSPMKPAVLLLKFHEFFK